mmetsp:Transcript_64433/g.102555  ORF Transcript_64433/g.102555 Transcript_64433/m.102555 type:complete len:190 (-) Transcript_64433:70-639(-)
MVQGLFTYKDLRMWQTKAKITNAVITAKWKVIFQHHSHRENEYFISYSFYHQETEYEVDRLSIGDLDFWHSLIVNTPLEIVYIPRNPKRFNKPSYLMPNPFKICATIITSVLFSFLCLLSALIIAISICHYKWDEILFALFVYPGIILILLGLCSLYWSGSIGRRRKERTVHPENNSLLSANNVRVQVY